MVKYFVANISLQLVFLLFIGCSNSEEIRVNVLYKENEQCSMLEQVASFGDSVCAQISNESSLVVLEKSSILPLYPKQIFELLKCLSARGIQVESSRKSVSHLDFVAVDVGCDARNKKITVNTKYQHSERNVFEVFAKVYSLNGDSAIMSSGPPKLIFE